MTAARTTIIGVDENGLGPRLGPLVVTGVRFRCAVPPPALAALRAATGLDDSKRVFSPARRDRGEALALGVLRPAPGERFADLLGRLAVPVPWATPAACASPETAVRGVCAVLPAVRVLPRWAAAPRDLAPAFAALGVDVERVAVAVLCPGMLNAALATGASKLAVDLALFETVATVLAAGAGGGAAIVCGKVGGTDRYAGRFAVWAGRASRVIEEGRQRSEYEVAGIGRVAFVRDADATEPAVAVASVVGKYVRELWMDDLAAAAGWTGPTPSGYHDAASTRLAEQLRERIAAGTCRLPEACVLRAR